MLSTPIPDEAAGYAMLEGAEDATWRLHGHYGARNAAGFGFLVETHQWRSDGFQDVDRGGESGLDLEDYTLKLSYAPEGSDHALAVKVQIAEQDSEQSYLGLTDVDFARDPFRRYGLSSLDNIATKHEQLIVRYQWTPSDSVAASVTYYNNEHERKLVQDRGHRPGRQRRCPIVFPHQLVKRGAGHQPWPARRGRGPRPIAGHFARHARHGAGQHPDPLQCADLLLPRPAGQPLLDRCDGRAQPPDQCRRPLPRG